MDSQSRDNSSINVKVILMCVCVCVCVWKKQLKECNFPYTVAGFFFKYTSPW